jgi:hypothetical protein
MVTFRWKYLTAILFVFALSSAAGSAFAETQTVTGTDGANGSGFGGSGAGEIVPALSRVAIVGIPDLNVAQFEATEMAVLTAVIEPEILEVRSPDDFESAFTIAKTRHAQAGILLSSPLVFVSSKRIGEIGIAKRLPLISLFSEFPKSGGLISYGSARSARSRLPC